MDSSSPGDEVTQSDFNNCVCLDLSQVKDCRSGTCYCYRWDGTYNQYTCTTSTGSYNYSCKKYVSYRC